MAVPARVRKMPTRNLDLVRDRVQSEKRSKRRGEKLSRVFPFRQDSMARAERSNIVITDVSPERFKLMAKVFFGCLPIFERAHAARDRVPRELEGALFESAELEMLECAGFGGHSQAPGAP